MPTYGYRCTACGTEFERIQKITDPPVSSCESCGAAVKKLLYPVGIQFKGSGFYVNDYAAKSGGGNDAAAASGGAKEAGSSDAAGKAEPASGTSAPAATETKTATPAPASSTSSTSS